MNIIVPIKQVPDLVEELEINSAGTDLDREWLKMKLNEFDDHALEEALLMKDDGGASVTAIALDGDDIDKALFAAAAKGADRLIKITGVSAGSSHEAAKAMANVIQGMEYDIVMTGVQAVDDRDGQLAVLLAHYLGTAHVSVVTGVQEAGGNVTVHKEYGAGMVAEFEASTPIVLGIQAARETPRYVPVAKIRRASRDASIEETAAGDIGVDAGSTVSKMYKPDTGAGAEMIAGSAEDQANKIVEILTQKGVK
jgi:electron transfer flavoprotein beta subunit